VFFAMATALPNKQARAGVAYRLTVGKRSLGGMLQAFR